RRGGGRPVARRAGRKLLHGPAVAGRVAEEDERAPGELLNLTDRRPASGKLRARGLRVGDHQLESLDGARPHAAEPRAQGNRTVRAGGRELDEADLIADHVVMVRVETDLLRVEVFRAVHVRDG